jgi:hypothetical protein
MYDSNYQTDHRVRGAERREVKFVIGHEDDDDLVELPTCWVVCPTCSGHGHHVNPSIDCDGLSNEDFSRDPDFREEYFSGAYDVTCYECGGLRVVKDLDTKRCTDAQLRAWYDKADSDAEYRAECEMERRMGA